VIETVAFDHAVATAARYAGETSLIVAVGKHGIGGLSLNGAASRRSRRRPARNNSVRLPRPDLVHRPKRTVG
jgi:alkaline phosphatase